MKTFIAISLLFFSLVGCSHSKDQGQTSPAQRESITSKRSLVENFRDNLKGRWLDRCDYLYRDQEEEVLKALDQHSDQINKLIQTSPGDSYFERVQVGPLWLNQTKDTSPLIDKWQHHYLSWENLSILYQKIKDSPVSEDWIFLNHRALFLLRFDHSRVVDGENMELGNDSGPLIVAAEDSISDCLNKPECALPIFSGKVELFMKTTTIYTYFIDLISQQGIALSEARTNLTKLLHLLQADHKFYEFVPDKLVRRISPTLLEADLDAGDFAGYEDKIGTLISKAWTVGDYRIRLNWKRGTSSEAISPYRFEAVRNSDGQDITWSDTRRIDIHQNSRITIFGHEFGHILGFRDHYYDVWKPNLCEYDEEYNDADLMSADTRGKANEGEWAELLKNYPLVGNK